MYRSVRIVISMLVVCIALLATCLTTEICLGQARQGPKKKAEIEIHEWGVFTAPRNAYWLKQDMLAEWSSFPDFFHGVWPKSKLAYYGPVTKPVIYFHARNKIPLALQIEFATGRPLVWWPPTSFPNTGGWAKHVSIRTGKPLDPERSLVFELLLNPDKPNFKSVAKNHWLNDLRDVDATPVSTSGGYSRMGSQRCHEKFVYYDGLMRCPPPPVVKRSESLLEITNETEHCWFDVFVVERGLEGDVRFKKLTKLESGRSIEQVQLEPLAKTPKRLLTVELDECLQNAGLNKDEALALLKVWGDGLLGKRGLTLFYRVDQKTYEKWLPLATRPPVNKTVRVGLVAHFHLEPELDGNIKTLVSQLGAKDYSVRASAERTLREIGGAAYPALNQAMESASPEVRIRCKNILAVKELEAKLGQFMKKLQSRQSPERQ